MSNGNLYLVCKAAERTDNGDGTFTYIDAGGSAITTAFWYKSVAEAVKAAGSAEDYELFVGGEGVAVGNCSNPSDALVVNAETHANLKSITVDQNAILFVGSASGVNTVDISRFHGTGMIACYGTVEIVKEAIAADFTGKIGSVSTVTSGSAFVSGNLDSNDAVVYSFAKRLTYGSGKTLGENEKLVVTLDGTGFVQTGESQDAGSLTIENGDVIGTQGKTAMEVSITNMAAYSSPTTAVGTLNGNVTGDITVNLKDAHMVRVSTFLGNGTADYTYDTNITGTVDASQFYQTTNGAYSKKGYLTLSMWNDGSGTLTQNGNIDYTVKNLDYASNAQTTIYALYTAGTGTSAVNGNIDVKFQDNTAPGLLFLAVNDAKTTGKAILTGNLTVSLDNTTMGDIYGAINGILNGDFTVSVTDSAASTIQTKWGEAAEIKGISSITFNGEDILKNTMSGFDNVTVSAGATVSAKYTWNADFAQSWNNEGTISLDMTGATAMQYKLVDNLTENAMTLENYGTVTLSSEDYRVEVIDKDLYAVSKKAVASITTDGMTTYYATLAEAISAASKLMRDADNRVTIDVIGKCESLSTGEDLCYVTFKGHDGGSLNGLQAATNAKLQGTHFEDVTFNGTFQIQACDDTCDDDIVITGCAFNGNGSAVNAIQIQRYETTTVNNLSILNNTFSNYTSQAIIANLASESARDSNLVIKGNTFDTINGGNLVQALNFDGVEISGNTVANCKYPILFNIYGCPTATVVGNDIALCDNDYGFQILFSNAKGTVTLAENRVTTEDGTVLDTAASIIQNDMMSYPFCYDTTKVVFITDETVIDPVTQKVTAGPVFASAANIANLVPEGYDVEFLENVESTLVYKKGVYVESAKTPLIYYMDVAGRKIELAGQLKGDVAVSEGYSLNIADGTAYDGKISLALGKQLTGAVGGLGEQALILIDEIFGDDAWEEAGGYDAELAAWKAARGFTDESLAVARALKAPDPTPIVDTTAGSESITINLTEANPTQAGNLSSGDGSGYDGTIIINSIGPDTEVRGNIEQVGNYQIIVNNGNTEETSTAELMAVTGMLASLGEKSNNDVIINNGAPGDVTERVLNGGNDNIGLTVKANRIEVNNFGHLVADFHATTAVIHNNSNQTLSGIVEVDTLRIDAEQSDGAIEGATITAVNLTLADTQSIVKSTITVKGGNNLVLDAGAVIKVDGNSLITANGIELGEGASITIDGTDFIGYSKVFALATAADVDKVNVTNMLGFDKTESGDIFVWNADISVLKVNAAWSSCSFGDKITLDSGDYYYGLSAFSALDDALVAYGTEAYQAETLQADIMGTVEAGSKPIAAGEKVVVANGAKLTGTLENNGVIELENAALDLTYTAELDGILDISGNADLSGTFSGNVNVADGTVISSTNGLEGGSFLVAEGAEAELNGTGFVLESLESAVIGGEGFTLTIGDGDAASDAQIGSLILGESDTVTFNRVSNEATDDGQYLIGGTANLTNGSLVKQASASVSGELTIGGAGNTGNSLTLGELSVEEDGKVTVAAGNSLVVSGELTNEGVIYAEYSETPLLSFGGEFDNSGTISIDLSAATGMSYQLIDNTGSTAMTVADYGSVELANGNYTLFSVDDDLYAYNTSVIKVNTSWTKQADVAEGYTWGINAFGSLEDATAVFATGSRTFEFVNANAAMMDLTLTVSAGFPTVSVSQNGAAVMSFSGGSAVTKSFEIAAGQTTCITVDGDSAVYTLGASLLEVKPNPEDGDTLTPTSAGGTVTKSGHVGYGTGSMSYELVVGEGTSGVYTFSIKTTDTYIDDAGNEVPYGDRDYISFSVQATDGKMVTYGDIATATTRKFELTAGTYTVTVDSLDHGKGQFNSSYEVSVTANKINGTDSAHVVSALDDSFTGTGVATLALAGSEGAKTGTVSDFVGLGDANDWIKLDAVESGSYTLTFSTAEAATAQGAHVYLYKVEDPTDAASRKDIVADAVYRGAAVTLNNIVLSANESYFIKVHANNAYTSNNDATYTLTLSENAAIKGVNATDDAWTTPSSLATEISDYVGTIDECDWYKLAAIDGACTLEVTAQGGLLFADIYALKAGSAADPLLEQRVQCKDGVTATQTFACAAGTEYYVKFSTQNGYNTAYTANIAAVI